MEPLEPVLKIFSVSALIFLLAGCSPDAELAPFTSEGCSLFPGSSSISQQDWCACCVEHDKTYWRGGTEAEREAADVALRDCVLQRTKNTTLANVMYEGVRFGGSPYFYNWYRWGYGWGFERTYQALTTEETALAHLMMQEYEQGNSGFQCAI